MVALPSLLFQLNNAYYVFYFTSSLSIFFFNTDLYIAWRRLKAHWKKPDHLKGKSYCRRGMYVRMYVCMSVCMYVCMYVYMYMYVCVCVCVCVCVYVTL